MEGSSGVGGGIFNRNGSVTVTEAIPGNAGEGAGTLQSARGPPANGPNSAPERKFGRGSEPAFHP